jgi:hypothetical protein
MFRPCTVFVVGRRRQESSSLVGEAEGWALDPWTAGRDRGWDAVRGAAVKCSLSWTRLVPDLWSLAEQVTGGKDGG